MREKNDQGNMKNVFGKAMPNKSAVCAWEIDASIYIECLRENDFAWYY